MKAIESGLKIARQFGKSNESQSFELANAKTTTTHLDNSENSNEEDCPYKKICHSDRINFIYMNKILGKDKMWISHNQNINYTTIQHIIKTFERQGRTNKKQFLNIEYLQGTSHVIGKKAKLTRKEGKIGRGRKKLDLDNSVLFDAFCEKVQEDRCRLKLYVD